MASFRLTLWSGKGPDRPVYLVFQHGRGRRATLATGIRVAGGDWNEKKSEVRRGRRNASALNRRLREVEAAAADAVDEAVASGEPVTAAGIRDAVASRLAPAPEAAEGAEPDFLSFMEGWVAGFAEAGRPSTYKAYRTVHRKLRAHAGGSLAYADLTPAFFKAWGRALAAPPPHGPGHKQNYVRKIMTSTRTAIRAAVLQDAAPEGFRDPFERLRGDAVLATEEARKRSVPIGSVRAIARADAQPGSLVEAVRDGFVFAFFAAGMRFGDVCLLRWGNVEADPGGRPVRIAYEAEKTGKRTAVSLPPEAVAVLERYAARAEGGAGAFVFPFLDRRDVSTPAKRRAAVGSLNAYANRKLKALARRAGIADPGSVTFHVARHSLAAHLHDAGLSAVAIKERLRHSSVATTERYLKGIDRERLDEEYLGAF